MNNFYDVFVRDPDLNRTISTLAGQIASSSFNPLPSSGNPLTWMPESVLKAPPPAPSTPSTKIKADQTTNTSGTDSNGGGNRGGQADPNAGPNDPGSVRDGKSDKGVLDGLATFGMNALAFTSPLGVMNAMKGALDPKNPSLSIKDAIADALGLGGGNGTFDGPGFSPESMAAMGFSANMDGARGYDGESGGWGGWGTRDTSWSGDPDGFGGSSGGTFSDWGGSQGIGWGGDPDGFGGSSGNGSEGNQGGDTGNTGGPGHSDGNWAEGGLVKGPGTGTSDSVKNQNLSNGEFVMPADVTKDFLPLLEYMRVHGKLPSV